MRCSCAACDARFVLRNSAVGRWWEYTAGFTPRPLLPQPVMSQIAALSDVALSHPVAVSVSSINDCPECARARFVLGRWQDFFRFVKFRLRFLFLVDFVAAYGIKLSASPTPPASEAGSASGSSSPGRPNEGVCAIESTMVDR